MTAVAVMTEAQCLEALEDLARNWSEAGGSVREAALSALVHPSWEGFALAEKLGANVVESSAGDVDLIVVGSHRPVMSDYLLGSNAKTIVRHAQCSVLVVRE